MNRKKTVINMEHLAKNFGSLQVLKDLSLEITEGEVVVLLSGKSTLLRCLNGWEKATQEVITVNGHTITDKNTNINRVRENVSMMFQRFNLFSHLNVLDNMILVPMDQKHATKKSPPPAPCI